MSGSSRGPRGCVRVHGDVGMYSLYNQTKHNVYMACIETYLPGLL